MGPERLRTMDGYGIDIQALSINPFWYGADCALSTKLIDPMSTRWCSRRKRSDISSRLSALTTS